MAQGYITDKNGKVIKSGVSEAVDTGDGYVRIKIFGTTEFIPKEKIGDIREVAVQSEKKEK